MIPPDCIPAHPKERVIEIESRPDTLGRSRFTMYWLTDDYNPSTGRPGVRAQCFFADIDEHVTNCTRFVDRRNTC